jgi:hypothetical protein
MEWGTVSDWVTALANVGLAGAAIFAARQGIRTLNAWRTETIGKRKAELAEQALISFYQAREVLSFVRTPVHLRGGAESTYLIPIQRLDRETELFAKIQTQRYSFAAVFGPKSTQPFDSLQEVHGRMVTAARTLSQMPQETGTMGYPNDSTTELKNTLGWGLRKRPDVIDKKIDEAIEAMEAICRPVLSESPPDAANHRAASSRCPVKWFRKA